MKRGQPGRVLACLGGLVLLGLLAVGVYFLPPVHERLAWRLAGWQAQFNRWLNPPQQVLFAPGGTQGAEAIQTQAAATLQVLQTGWAATPQSTPPPVIVSEAKQSLTAAPQSPTPPVSASAAPQSPTPTLLPPGVQLTGIVFEYQQFNNCGPANLAMALSYWGWVGAQNQTRAYLRPNRAVDDKNVNPDEMVAFVATQTELNALRRVGGDLDTLRRFLAAGFPVLIEKGHDPADDWWMGHYVVVSGYDDAQGRLTIQDSLIGPDRSLSYEELAHEWRDFNFVYLVIYPTERMAEVQALLGPHLDSRYNYEMAMYRAQDEAARLAGREQFFAWFNLGSSRAGLELYPWAAEAYDQAFALYAALPEEDRPYRLMWYQAGPYQAYYFTGRYQDVIDLANTTLTWVGQGVLEETFYWRGLAYAALGNLRQAIADWKKAATLNPNYLAPRQALEQHGEQAP